MVLLNDVQESNSRADKALPAGLVGVFVGATSGIGETALREFSRICTQPRVYFIGRSQEAGDRLIAELKQSNPGGHYTFLKTDVSLLKNVDKVCKDIQNKENAVNVLFLSQGTLMPGETSENLPIIQGVTYYSRMRFVINLLPQLQNSPSLRRVITVLAGGFEGKMFTDDFVGRKVAMSNVRGHSCSMMTLALEAISQQAPSVSFIHNYPGAVNTNLIRGDEGFMLQVVKYYFKLRLAFKRMPLKECGERHAFLCTSAKYPPSKDTEPTSGVPLTPAIQIAKGVDGRIGSGVYSVNHEGESMKPEIEELLGQYRREGMVEKVWKHTEGEFSRITGLATAL